MNDLAEIKRLRAENEKHKLLWQEAEKRVFGADMWVRGVTKELETLRANALTAEEAKVMLFEMDDGGPPERNVPQWNSVRAKLARIAS